MSPEISPPRSPFHLLRNLRQTSCRIAVTWKDTTGKPPESPLRWSFQLDLESAYLPDGE